ncbi:MAG: putative acetyltransferase [Crocinitomicaceae bacterium]
MFQFSRFFGFIYVQIREVVVKESKSATVNFRKIESRDNLELAALIRGVLKEHGIDKPGTVYTDPTTDALFELFEREKAIYWIAEMNGRMVGGCGIYPTPGLDADCTELVKLYVNSKTRGLGLGRELMNISINSAIETGYSKIYLETLPELSSAIGLYESLGFKSLSAPLGNSGHFACNLWMLKEVDSE